MGQTTAAATAFRKAELWQCVWILCAFSFVLPLSFVKPNFPSLKMTSGMVVRGCVFRNRQDSDSAGKIHQGQSVKAEVAEAIETQGRSVGTISKLCAVESVRWGLLLFQGFLMLLDLQPHFGTNCLGTGFSVFLEVARMPGGLSLFCMPTLCWTAFHVP